MSMKKQLLDPIGTSYRLRSLKYCDKNTKISIQNHVLVIQIPSGYQFMIRMYNGDGRENVSELYDVVIRLISWFIVPRYKTITSDTNIIDINIINDLNELHIEESNESDDSNQDSDLDNSLVVYNDYLGDPNNSTNQNGKKNNCRIEMVAEYDNTNAIEISKSNEIIIVITELCDAFSTLQKTYKDGNVVLALQFYINLLNSAINGKYSDDQLPKYILKKDKDYENLIDYNKLKNLWNVGDMKRLNQLYADCDKVKNDIKLSEKTRESLIKGNLTSIYSILDDHDVEFQKLIQNSNRG